jgi:gliding motility-associated-like protein
MRRILTLILFFFSLKSFSQNTFVKTYGNGNSDFGTSCTEAFDKGLILVISTVNNGVNIQTGLVKTNSNGQLLWTKNKQVGTYSIPQTVVESSDSGIVILGGGNYDPQSNGNNDFLFLFKTDSAGNDIWSKEFRLSASDRPVKLIKCAAGGFIMCSIGNYNLGIYPSANIVRLDDNGSMLWSKTISVPYGLSPTAIVETINGNICMVSTAVGFNPFFSNDLAVCYFDSMGNEIWSKVFQSDYQSDCNFITTNSSGELFLSGRTFYMGREWDSFYLKLDAGGNPLFQKAYDAGTSDGEIMRAGIAFDDGSSLLIGDMGSFDERDITMLRVNADGNIRWARKYPFSPNFTNYPYDVIHTSDNAFVFTGDIRPPATYRDAALVKTNDQGEVTCYLDTSVFTVYTDTFTEVTPVLLITDNLLLPVDSLISEPFNIITEKTVCQQIFPIADFTFSEDTICTSQCVSFTDLSQNQPTEWYWTFANADSTYSILQNPEEICFPSKGKFNVTLVVTNVDGSSSVTKEINVGSECPVVPFVIPNVFTPNGDGINDFFEIENLPVSAEISVYNRWGIEMFSSENKKRFWNGFDEKGSKANDGVYYYVVNDNGTIYKGTIQLIGSN